MGSTSLQPPQMSATCGSRSGLSVQQAMAAAQAVAARFSSVTQHDLGLQQGSTASYILDCGKQPMNPYYIHWSCGQRHKLSQERPKMKPLFETTKRMGEEWKLLTKAEKLPFVEEAKRLKAVLIREHPDYKIVRRKTIKKYEIPASKGPVAGQQNEGQQQVSNDEQDLPLPVPYGDHEHLQQVSNREHEEEPQQSPNGEQKQYQVLNEEEDQPLPVPHGVQEQKPQQVPSNLYFSKLLSTMATSSIASVADCQYQEAENDALNQASVDAFYEGEVEHINQLIGMEPHRTSAFPNANHGCCNDLSWMSSTTSNSSSAAAADSEQLIPNDEEEEQQLITNDEQEEQQLISDVEVELPYDEEEEDIEQENLPNVSEMSSETSNSSSAQAVNCQQQVAGNEAQHLAAVDASLELQTQLNRLAGIIPSHTSASSIPAASHHSISTQCGPMPGQQQLSSGWMAATTAGKHHFGAYPLAHYQTREDLLKLRVNNKGNKMRQLRTVFSPLQLQHVNYHFQQNQNPNCSEEAQLTATLGPGHHQVKNWFNSQWQKYKKLMFRGYGLWWSRRSSSSTAASGNDPLRSDAI